MTENKNKNSKLICRCKVCCLFFEDELDEGGIEIVSNILVFFLLHNKLVYQWNLIIGGRNNKRILNFCFDKNNVWISSIVY